MNDSFEAADAVAAARKLAKRGRWSEAAELLQRTADTLGDKLVQVDVGYYMAVSRHVTDVLSAWPAEGLRVYRTLYAGAMQDALRAQSATRRADALLPLFDRYFCTSSAAQLADRIGQLAIESGDVALAERVYARALRRHPDRAAHAAQWGAMLAVVGAMRGHRDADLSGTDMDAKIRWMGEQRTLRAVIEAIDRSFSRVSAEAAESPSDWPVFGGRSDRGRIGSSRVDELGLLWRFHFARSPARASTTEDLDLAISDTDTTTNTLVHPVVSGDGIVMQQFRDVVALHRNTGAEVWHFSAGDGGGASQDDIEERPVAWGSPTIHEHRVYAALPGEGDPYYGFESARSTTELVCLDLATGRTIWRSSRDRLGESFTELQFDSSPIVSHGRVYLAARRRRSFGFEDCYLYAFNAADGTLQFKTHLGSASTGTFGSRQATMGIPALLGDTVYVSTSLGSVAAVSAHTGVVRWLRLYERDVDGKSTGSSWLSRQMEPWEFNPVLPSHDRVICLPNDARNLLVLSEEDGKLLRSIPRDSLGGIRTLLGVRGDLLCGSGDEIACYDLLAGSVRWVASLPDAREVLGRGAWVDDRLLIPSERGLHIFELADGARTDLSWDVDGEPGNIVALSDRLIVAGTQSISAYVRKEEIWTALRDRMALAPSDPAPALDLAEVAFGSGELAEALGALEETVRRAGGFAAPMEPELAARVFSDALSFADKLAARDMLEPDTLDMLFSYASQYPPGRAEHVRYRLRFGTFFEKLALPERALPLYQQILRDRSLREFSDDPIGVGVETAGQQARTRINRLIEQHGRDIYAIYETEATSRLAAAKDARDETMFARIVEAFPNARAAPLSLIAHGSLLSELDRPAEAAGRFAAAYHRYPKQADRPTLLRFIADAYDQAGKHEHAYRWLTKAAREYPSAMIESQGRRMSFLEYRKRLDYVRKKVEPSRPNIVLPLDRHFTRNLEESASLLTPLFPSEASCDWSRYFVRTPTGIRAFDAATGAELWPREPKAEGEKREDPGSKLPTVKPSRIAARGAELLVARADVAVFATRDEVFALDSSTGARRWLVGGRPAGVDEVVADWEDESGFRTHALADHRLVSVKDDGEFLCMDIRDGRVLWSEAHTPAPTGRVRVRDAVVAYAVAHGDGVTVYRLDAGDGTSLGAMDTAESRTMEDLFITLDNQIVLVTAGSIAAYDADAIRPRWRVDLEGRLQRATLLLDVDALYFSDDARHLKKISLEDGRLLWRSEQLLAYQEDGVTAQLQGGHVIVSTASSAVAVDTVTGLALWHAATPENARFAPRIMTSAYVLAVHLPEATGEAPAVAYFYDHRNGSGVIPRAGGAPNLGRLADVRAILALDATLLIQTGSTLHTWTRK